MEEIKNMLQAILGRLDEQGAELKAIREDISQMKEDISELKQGQVDIQEDVRMVVRDVGEHDFQIRRLKQRFVE